MVPIDVLTEKDARLSEIFSLSIELLFTGLLVVVIGDYLLLHPVRGRFVFLRSTSEIR